MRSASTGCERPEKTISRFCGVSGIACPGFNAGSTVACSSPGSVCSIVPASTASFLDDLTGREPDERVVRDVVGYDRAGGCPRIVSHCDRSNEHSVHGDPDVTPDPRAATCRAPGGAGSSR